MIITGKKHLRELWELFHPSDVKVKLYKFFETEGYISNDVLLTVHIMQT